MSGQVVFVNGLSHCFIFIGEPGISPAHNALQLGEFTHRAGYQVRFTQEGRPTHGRFFFRGYLVGHVFCQSLEPFQFLVRSSQLGVEDNLLQLFNPVIKRDFLILHVVKTGVFQTSPEHVLITLGDNLRIAGQGIVDRNKMGHHFTRIVQHCEVALVKAHGSDEDLRRQLQIVLVETATDSSGILSQLNYLIQKTLVLTDIAIFLLGASSDNLPYSLSPLLYIYDDKPFAQGLNITVDITNFEWPGAHEAMPIRGVATCDVAIGEWDHFLTQQGDDPVYRSGKGNFQVTPAHGLGKGYVGD